MRGGDGRSGELFSYVDLERRMPAGHPLGPRLLRRDDDRGRRAGWQVADPRGRGVAARASRPVRPGLPPHQRRRHRRDGLQRAHRVVHAGFTASSIDFDWKGTDEGDQVQGTGWADLRDDGHFEGEIA